MAIRIDRVDAGSEAEALGLAGGDELLSVDGNELNDTLDYDFYTDSKSFHLKARVADGIRAVGELLRGERLLFQAECVHTATEFRSYVWDEKNAAQGVDKPVKEHDHCMDAVRYFVMTVVQRESARARRRPSGL